MEKKVITESLGEKELVSFFIAEINNGIEKAESLKSFLTGGQREISIVYTKLEEAKMWAERVLAKLWEEESKISDEEKVEEGEEEIPEKGE